MKISRRLKRVAFATVVIVFFIGIAAYIIRTDLDYRIRFAAWMSSPNQEFIEENDLRRIKIEFSEEDKSHYERLFQDYYGEGNGPGNEAFLAYYGEHNDWREMELEIDGIKHPIKAKSQGRTPYAHKYGDHFSMAVKFQEKPYPFYAKRINLVIYSRIENKHALLKMVAEKFDLPKPDYEMIVADIADRGDHLYFIEERIDKHFFEARKLPWVIFNKGNTSSLIFNNLEDIGDLKNQMKEELAENDDLSPTLKAQIARDYFTYNNALIDENIDTLKAYTDLDYFARVTAFRIVWGADGHGFGAENLEMAYDTIGRKFYPIIHRDLFTTNLPDCQNPYSYLDETREEIPFSLLLNSDPAVQGMIQEKLDEFLSNNSADSIEKEVKDILDFYLNSHTYEFSSISGIEPKSVDGSSITNNVRCLEESR